MNNFFKNVVCVICIVAIAGFISTEPNYSRSSVFGGIHSKLGIFFLKASQFVLLAGSILFIFKKTRQAGLAILLAGGLIYLIGFSICSIPSVYHE